MASRITDIYKEPMPIELPGISDIQERMKEIHELIARRAFEIYERHGHVDGREKEDWSQAEPEVLASFPVRVKEQDGYLSVVVGIKPCQLPGLQVRIEPRRLIVSGKRPVVEGQILQVDPNERPKRTEIFQILDLPAVVEPLGAQAIFSEDLLEFRIPMAKTKLSAGLKIAKFGNYFWRDSFPSCHN
jgi:hypothetical protein